MKSSKWTLIVIFAILDSLRGALSGRYRFGEESYNYTTIEKLRNDFRADLELELAKRGLV